MNPVIIGNATLYLGDCREILPTLPKVDAVITDPPYPTAHPEFGSSDIQFMDIVGTSQLVFWSALGEFPLSYSAVHIWHKKTPNEIVAYERIFERRGSTKCKLYAHYFMNSSVAASYGGDVFYGHPTQKPIRLMNQLIDEFTEDNHLICDPFMGSGTTGVACMNLGRKFIGIEIEPKYFDIACRRIEDAQRQQRLIP